MAEIYESIEDMHAGLETGLTELEMAAEQADVGAESIQTDFDFELLQIAFLSQNKKEFDDVIDLIDPTGELAVADLDKFDDFKKALQKTASRENVRSLSAILAKMAEIVKAYYAAERRTDEAKGKTPKTAKA